jgi:acylphosphatase
VEPAGAETRSLRVVISGRVQGVWFRAWTEQQANRHRLDGWVRNCRNGTVEALFSGRAVDVKAMLDDCSEGPLGASVTSVESHPAGPPEGKGFKVLPTV